MITHIYTNLRRLFVVVFIVLGGPTLSVDAQDVAPPDLTLTAIEDSLMRHFNRIEDYTAQVKISVAMPRLRIPAKRVKLYYKRPDRVKVESEGFAVVPRTGLALSPGEMMNDLYRPQVTGTAEGGDRKVWLVEGRIHPDSLRFSVLDHGPGEDVKLRMRLWIDTVGWFVSRVEPWLIPLR